MVLGGRKPSPLFLRDLKDLGWDLWAVDKGIESCKKVDWQPSMALGDMDSVCSDALAWVRNLQIPMEIHPAEKDLTDFQLALGRISKTCTATQDVPVLVTGCFGGRLDHLVSSVMSFCYAPGIVPVGMVDQREMAFILKDYDNISLEFKGLCAPKNISLLPLEDCSGVSESGVKWELHDAFLKKSLPFAISNEPTSDKVRISLSTGILIVYLRW
ncbi:MAG: thiamine diphosphokinase [Thermanaerothrix sp.]|nr:thiamine diphosphokinase [Thermanaerothrix sp.]